ncbi:MAG: hypothetical protein QXD77_01980 [Candidatus Aenigmatarchaeota archaeon]
MGTKKGQKYLAMVIIEGERGEKLGDIPGAFAPEYAERLSDAGLHEIGVNCGKPRAEETKKRKSGPQYLNEAEKK